MSDQHSLPRAGDFLPLKPGMILPALPFMLAGAALFVNGARGDLWLDEIWSLNLIEPVASFGDILLDINHDNNHVLNSMYLYLIGTDASPIALRGLSVVFGVISIAVAGLVLLRNGAIPAMVGMALFAVSYPVVHYEINTASQPELSRFYAEAFGWSMQPETDDYIQIDTDGVCAGTGAPGIDGGIGPSDPGDDFVTFYVQVPDVDATLARVVELGGEVDMPPTEAGHIVFAIVRDPHGNRIGLVRA